MAETDLYAPVRNHFLKLGFDVQAEIRNCDVVAARDDLVVSIELKTAFTLKLVYQGMDKQASSDLVYLAIPACLKKAKGRRSPTADMTRLCRKAGLGLLEVYGESVHVLCEAEPTGARPKSTRRLKILKEFRARSGDHNVGGSTGVKRVTGFIEHSVRLARLAKANGTVSPADGRKAGVLMASGILTRNHLTWFRRQGHGRYALTEVGLAGLDDYAHVVSSQIARESKAI